MQPIVELKNIGLNYHSPSGETNALTHINFQVSKGEFICIVGPSGCGNAQLQQSLALRSAIGGRKKQSFLMVYVFFH